MKTRTRPTEPISPPGFNSSSSAWKRIERIRATIAAVTSPTLTKHINFRVPAEVELTLSLFAESRGLALHTVLEALLLEPITDILAEERALAQRLDYLQEITPKTTKEERAEQAEMLAIRTHSQNRTDN